MHEMQVRYQLIIKFSYNPCHLSDIFHIIHSESFTYRWSLSSLFLLSEVSQRSWAQQGDPAQSFDDMDDWGCSLGSMMGHMGQDVFEDFAS